MDKTTTSSLPHKVISSTLLIIAGLLLFLAQSAFWLSNTIFNQQAFTQAVIPALTSETSRQAFASTIVDQALADRPVLNKVIGSRATSFMSGLLGSDLGSQAVTGIVNRSYVYLTTADRQDIGYDLQAIKEPISGIIAFAESQGREIAFNPDSIPDEVILLRSDQIPNLSGLAIALQWLSPLLWLATAACFATYIYRSRHNYARSVYIVGGVIAAVGLIGLLAGPYLPPSLAILVPASQLRVVVQDVATALLQPFMQQMLIMLAVTIIAMVVFNQRFTILNLAHKASQAVKTT